ncbi:MAG: aminotransferase class IV [Rickettsiales bacterium]
MNKDLEQYIWLNGEFITVPKDKMDVLSHELCYGLGAFEEIRFYNKKAFNLDEHLELLFKSSKALLLNTSFSFQEIKNACIEIIKVNKVEDGYIKPLIFLGNKDATIGAENYINILIGCWSSIHPLSNSLSDKVPLKLSISSAVKPPFNLLPYQVKASELNILNKIAEKQAITQGYDGSLILDYRGYIADSTLGNFFIVKNKTIYTPIPEYCFEGITSKIVIEIAIKNNIEVKEKYITLEDLADADEAFITSTISEISSIASIGDYIFKNNSISEFIYSKFYQLTLT